MNAEQLQAILSAHRDWLADETTGSRADLYGADLSGANLSRADLYGADLSGANLSGADLSRANLSGANLSRADLYGADLSGANLSRADLYGANLSGADLSGANLSRANLSGANLSGANLSRANLSRADLYGADLSRANLSGADLSGANLSWATGLLDPIEWIAASFKRTRGGIVAYKTFGGERTPPDSWTIKPGAEIAEVVNPLPTLDCASGINVATLEWCKSNYSWLPIWSLLVKWEWMVGAVVPYNTTGKFRVPRARLIEVVREPK